MGQNLKTTMLDLEAIIDALDHVEEVEKYNMGMVGNKQSFIVEKYKLNISLAKECKESLSFVVENLPDLDSRFNEMNTMWHSPRKLKFVQDIGKYRTEITKAKRAIEVYVWASRNDSHYENRELPSLCMEKLKAAYNAIIKIK